MSTAGSRPFVILGGGMAGGVAARTLRQEGCGGRLLLISNEPCGPAGSTSHPDKLP